MRRYRGTIHSRMDETPQTPALICFATGAHIETWQLLISMMMLQPPTSRLLSDRLLLIALLMSAVTDKASGVQHS